MNALPDHVARIALSTIVRDAWRVLTFRRPSPALATHWRAYLAFGLACTWLAGIGRYWDSPRAAWWQHLGLGSLAYVIVLALVLWLLLMPLRPARWSYRNVLVFVTLTAPPALLYAIPVERFMPLDAAQATNAWFLAIVASWRVALLAWFLARVAGLRAHVIVVATLLPITLIVVALSLLNLEHVVFNIMAGISEEQRSPNDQAYFIVVNIAIWSVLLAPILFIAYAVMAFNAWGAARRRALAGRDRD
ncbi:MAG TPA: hypothetical protein PKO41_01840 [Dokdonella sp.]|uniref:hypothetical protein n=1 Tax=Dokdonella sp. TaxID=2291710 RepID=UPI0025C6D508|nr:hypothetical protein [Dokdonella sp.]MBX3691380.1 hypothetical protein [Dokdonella sp.]MCW5566752.1 hypothetical protein [Dokdonella sp.]HNR91143.1 hypothetical protein [Dokdonella sp.]